MEGSGTVLINGQVFNSLRGQQGVVFTTNNTNVIPTVNCLLAGKEMVCQKIGDKSTVPLHHCQISGTDANRQIYCLYPGVNIGKSNGNWILWLILFIIILAIVWLVMRKHVDNGNRHPLNRSTRRSPMRWQE